MRRISTTVFLGILALTITGCPSSNDSQSINPVPSPSTAPVVVQTPPAPKPFSVAQNPNSAAYLAPGLIQPTNANQRIKQVAKGNRDPFTALFLPIPVPPVSVSTSANNSSAPAQAPETVNSPTTSSQTTKRKTSSRNSTAGQSRPNSVAINNPRIGRTSTNQGSTGNGTDPSNQNPPFPPNMMQPDSKLQPALLPEPDLAKSVIVMGVIQVGEQTLAIIQVPSEATSRYVQVGQRLSNGQVLVKRIELNAGAEPLVILEQYGIEVSKSVGEAPSQGQPTTPTAELPAPPQNISPITAELPAPPQNINAPRVNFVPSTLSPKIPVATR